jgi:hypothetical protein
MALALQAQGSHQKSPQVAIFLLLLGAGTLT